VSSIKKPSTILSEEDELRFEKNIVWVTGSPRSGTTWLSSELLGAKCNFIHEPLIGEHVVSVKRFENRPLGRRFDLESKRSGYFFAEKFSENWLYFLRKMMLNRFYAEYPDLQKKLSIQEPNGVYGMDIIAKALPQSKIIILLREPKDIILSQIIGLSKGGYAANESKDWKPLEGQRRGRYIKNMAHQWNFILDILIRIYENTPKENCIVVEYEKLRFDTFNELKKIYQFIDVPISDEELKEIVEKWTFENLDSNKKGIGTPKQFAKPGLWKEKLTANEINSIEEIIGEKVKIMEEKFSS